MKPLRQRILDIEPDAEAYPTDAEKNAFNSALVHAVSILDKDPLFTKQDLLDAWNDGKQQYINERFDESGKTFEDFLQGRLIQ